MIITSEISLRNFDGWSGATDTLATLTTAQLNTLENILVDCYPEGMTDTQLNDILWFETDWIAEMLGFKDWEDLEESNEEE